MLTKQDIDQLKKPLPDEKVSVKVQSFSKDRTKAMLVCYLSHTDVAEWLETVDPAWSFDVVRTDTLGAILAVQGKLTVKGVSRVNVGEGEDYKSAYSDALKRCAMLFGVGRYLYDQEMVWVPYNDQQDRFRTWTLEDFRTHGGKKAPAPKPSVQGGAPSPIAPKVASPVGHGPAPTPRATIAAPKIRTVENNPDFPVVPNDASEMQVPPVLDFSVQQKILDTPVPGTTFVGKKLSDITREEAIKLAQDAFSFLTGKKQRVPQEWGVFFMAVEELYGVTLGVSNG